jgi:hypothetical protein
MDTLAAFDVVKNFIRETAPLDVIEERATRSRANLRTRLRAITSG